MTKIGHESHLLFTDFVLRFQTFFGEGGGIYHRYKPRAEKNTTI